MDLKIFFSKSKSNTINKQRNVTKCEHNVIQLKNTNCKLLTKQINFSWKNNDKKIIKKIESDLKVLQLNCNGLESKLEEIEVVLCELKPDLFFVSETHVSSNNSFTLPNYHSPLQYCRQRQGGGVALFIKNHLYFQEKKELYDLQKDSIFEFVAADLYIGNEIFTCVSLYRTPPKQKLFLDDFLERFDSLCSRIDDKKQLIFAGDINIDVLKNETSTKIFNDVLSCNNLKFLNSIPTRQNACLDNIIVKTNYENILQIKTLKLGISDHDAIALTLSIDTNNNVSSSTNSTMKKINYNKLNVLLNQQDQSVLYSTYDVDQKHDILLKKLNECLSSSTTIVKCKRRKQTKNWITKEVIHSS